MPLLKREADFKEEPWPQFTEAQAAFLEKLFPPRCIGTDQRLEDHLRYAGKVDLVARIRANTITARPSAGGADLTEDEEEAMLDSQVVTQALGTQSEEEQ